jgi:thymidylate kinase
MQADVAYELSDSDLVSAAAEALHAKLRKRGLAVCLSGIDGSGKTTLARNLVRVLKASGVPVRHLHLHQWYVNLFVTPVLLIHNRYFARRLLVFDRTIYDNIAVASIRRRCPQWLSRLTLAAVLAYYTRFDYRFYLVVEFSDALARRPDTDRDRFTSLSKIYEEVTSRARYSRLRSDLHLFDAVVRKLAIET